MITAFSGIASLDALQEENEALQVRGKEIPLSKQQSGAFKCNLFNGTVRGSLIKSKFAYVTAYHGRYTSELLNCKKVRTIQGCASIFHGFCE